MMNRYYAWMRKSHSIASVFMSLDVACLQSRIEILDLYTVMSLRGPWAQLLPLVPAQIYWQ